MAALRRVKPGWYASPCGRWGAVAERTDGDTTRAWYCRFDLQGHLNENPDAGVKIHRLLTLRECRTFLEANPTT